MVETTARLTSSIRTCPSDEEEVVQILLYVWVFNIHIGSVHEMMQKQRRDSTMPIDDLQCILTLTRVECGTRWKDILSPIYSKM